MCFIAIIKEFLDRETEGKRRKEKKVVKEMKKVKKKVNEKMITFYDMTQELLFGQYTLDIDDEIEEDAYWY
jgi:ribosomal protein S11